MCSGGRVAGANNLPCIVDVLGGAIIEAARQVTEILETVGIRLDESVGCSRKDATPAFIRSEEHTSELQSLMRISYAVFCLKKKTEYHTHLCTTTTYHSQN